MVYQYLEIFRDWKQLDNDFSVWENWITAQPRVYFLLIKGSVRPGRTFSWDILIIKVVLTALALAVFKVSHFTNMSAVMLLYGKILAAIPWVGTRTTGTKTDGSHWTQLYKFSMHQAVNWIRYLTEKTHRINCIFLMKYCFMPFNTILTEVCDSVRCVSVTAWFAAAPSSYSGKRESLGSKRMPKSLMSQWQPFICMHLLGVLKILKAFRQCR